MNVRELLENYNNYLAEIKTKKYQIKKLELEEISINGSNFKVNGDIKPKGYMISNIENKKIDNIDKINKLKKELEELEAKIGMIDSLLNTLNSFNKRLLELRYKNILSIESIAGDIGRDVPSVSRTINNCIKKMNKIYQKNNMLNKC